MTTAQTTPGQRRRRLPIELRSRIERDVAEIREELAQMATKEDLANTEDRIKRHIDGRTADILEVLQCGAAKSSSG